MIEVKTYKTESAEKDDKRSDRTGETFFKGAFLDVIKAISNCYKLIITKTDCCFSFFFFFFFLVFFLGKCYIDSGFSFEFPCFQINHHWLVLLCL